MANKGLRRERIGAMLWNSEEDFAATLVDWLRDLKWEVYQEVQSHRGDSRADIVAVQGRLLWVIETKLSFSLELLWQAWQWKHWAHYVSVSVPAGMQGSKGKRMTQHFCRLMEIGLLVGRRAGYTKLEGGEFDEEIAPRLDRKANVGPIRDTLTEEHKTYAKAGNSHGLFYSPFRATCDRVKKAVTQQPGLTMKELIDGIETHYQSTATARSSLAKWIDKGVVEGVRSERDGRFLRLYPTNGKEKEEKK